MEVGDWITLGAVIVALGIGVSSILHTRSLQKKERKERLLNEIIDWSIDLIKTSYGQDISVITMEEHELILALSYGFIQIKSRSKYINNIAKVFGKRLSSLIIEATNALESAISKNEEWMECKKEESDKKMKEVAKTHLILERNAIAIIEEASQIKTEII